MLSSLIGLLVLVQEAPAPWYQSTTELFEFCASKDFKHPLCPAIGGESYVVEIRRPRGYLTAENLLRAWTGYQMKESPLKWLESLNLLEQKPVKEQERIWADALYLYGKILFDQRRFQESEQAFDKIVKVMKTRGLYHQERAWALYFTGKWDRSLGAMVSAENKLIYPVPYFEKFFLRALVERDTCRWDDAFSSIAWGRKKLKEMKETVSLSVTQHPWVVLCQRQNMGKTCDALKDYYSQYYLRQIDHAFYDLDLLELEMKDRGLRQQKEFTEAQVTWRYSGENWKDELGFFAVPLKNLCG